MFEKILFPTDFSEVSTKALAVLKHFKSAGAKEIVVLHVIDRREVFALEHYSDALLLAKMDRKETEKRVYEHAERDINAIKENLQKEGFNVKTRIEVGVPFSEILKVETEENVSDIVIGSHGKSNISEMLLGSVSEKVIRKSKKPVYIVKR